MESILSIKLTQSQKSTDHRPKLDQIKRFSVVSISVDQILQDKRPRNMLT